VFVVAAREVRELRGKLAGAESEALRLAKSEADAKSILASAQGAATQMLEHARSVLIASDQQARAKVCEAERYCLESRPTEAPRAMF